MLLFVRHAMPLATEGTRSSSWALTADAKVAARRLRARLPSDAFLAASCERKAWETVGEGHSEVKLDARFNEVIREDEPWGYDFRRLRRLYVEGLEHPGWESHEDAATRFDAGVVAVRYRAGDRPVVIATHGMALTTWLVSIGAVSSANASGFWSNLRFPDCIDVDPAGAVRRYA